MGGKVLELESDKLINKGINKGIQKNQIDTVLRMLQAGKYAINEIAEISGITVERVNEIKQTHHL